MQALPIPGTSYVLVGGHTTGADNGDIWDGPKRGGTDIWLVLIDLSRAGAIVWDGLYGGSRNERLIQMEWFAADSSVIAYAYSESGVDMDKMCSGSPWIFTLDYSTGAILEDLCLDRRRGIGQIPVGFVLRPKPYDDLVALWYDLYREPHRTSCCYEHIEITHSLVNHPYQTTYWDFYRYIDGCTNCPKPDCEGHEECPDKKDLIYLATAATPATSSGNAQNFFNIAPNGPKGPERAQRYPQRHKPRHDKPLAPQTLFLAAQPTESAVDLRWQLQAPGYLIDSLHIERGSRPDRLEPLHTLPPTTTSWTDRSPLVGMSWYRVVAHAAGKQTVASNLVELRRTDSATAPSATLWCLYPTPADAHVYIRRPDQAGPATIRVYDLHGRLMAETSLAPPQTQFILETAAWPTGLYSAQLLEAGAPPQAFRVWIQR